MLRTLVLLSLGLSVLSCAQPGQRVKAGLDVFLENPAPYLKGKRWAIITNHSGITSEAEHVVDVMKRLEKDLGVTIAAVFAPEHGFRGDLPDGARAASYVDSRTGVRVWSLYGRYFKPTEEMLKDIDLLIYDVQDVGTRFYTYISTMGLCMEAAAERGIPFMVLDRPNPVTGTRIAGPIIEERHYSFVGKFPIPIRYGMTPGELARMIKGEGWMNRMDDLDLKVVPMEGWRRRMWFDETGLPWVKPSPNIPSVLTEILYPGLCLVEALNLSEGRGTMRPFEKIGAPWIDGDTLADHMNGLGLPGIRFTGSHFTPVGIPQAAPSPKYKDEPVHGLEMIVTDRENLDPLRVTIHLFHALKSLYPEELVLRTNLERLIGVSAFRGRINSLADPEDILREWEEGLSAFKAAREKYLLYR
jgi:uncharacterized protein YbbC (DUF1343 family)